MRRRDVLSLLGGAAVSWPRRARAQQGAMPVVGFLNSETPQPYARFVDAFQQGLKELAYVDGQNVVIQYHWAGERYDLLPALASDLVRRNVAVIVTNPPSVLPAKAATPVIPILFVTSLDPVEAGIVNSLNRPGGNLTGITSLNVEVAPKRLEILHELLPAARVIGALVNPAGPNAEAQSQNLAAAAHSLGVQLQIVHSTTEAELDTAVAELGKLGVSGLVISADPLFVSRSEQRATITLRNSVAAIWQGRECVAAGGLMSYGTDIAYIYRQLGLFTGRILRGEKPADLPVQQVTKVELVINLNTAKALGLIVPLPLLGRADEVIE